jgi:ketosteroid isomerase-like protein
VLTTVEAQDTVALELEITGTHTAPLAGPGGELSPTGREIRLRVANIWRVRDGRVTSYRVYFDQATFMAQLGLVPGAAGAR